ncbi:tyrosine-type recombinase/integrase [Moritella viscosa]|uniref:Site-specific recombinase, phage integrase family protein n=1 Tax=Moritella viscosa TaxID=80854 RepID=A0ABY1HCY5_9GAMM|nr:site-specific integrase [Moritella viscosa]SGY87234.1 Site-specific recombinase, phage integrase family protein [Moritella viscosa]SGY93407.1 Site-specific recombinase, phage integrase family protein [Moritella viscosa]SHO28116.1 Site-specific recombinase, phage integrase family protein [Moritella viscosa]
MTDLSNIHAKSAYIPLHKGLSIRKVPQSRNWGLYLKFDGHKPLQFSLKTSDLETAIAMAWEEYTLNNILLRRGEMIRQPQQRITLHELIDEIVKEYKKLQISANLVRKARKGNERYSTELRFWNRFKEYYSNKMLPRELGIGNVREFIIDFGSTSKNTIGKIKFCFRTILERSLEKKLITRDNMFDMSKISFEKNDEGIRDHFTEKEFELLIDFASNKYKTNGKGIHTNKMCIGFVSYLYHVGIRPGNEALNIKWSDLGINNHGDLFCVIRKGKTESYGKSKRNRHVIVDTDAHKALIAVAKIKHFNDIKNLNDNEVIEYLSRNHADEFVFSTKFSNSPNYSLTLKHWLEELRNQNLISKDKNLVLYSFRHSYITRSIERGNIPLSLLAENAGTSVQMIETHYSHISTMSEASRKYLVSQKLENELKESKLE